MKSLNSIVCLILLLSVFTLSTGHKVLNLEEPEEIVMEEVV
jgi:hypothetical protein